MFDLVYYKVDNVAAEFGKLLSDPCEGEALTQ